MIEMKAISLLALALVSATFASAEIEKTSVITKKGIELFWWPKIYTPTGWARFQEESQSNGCNMLGPMGSNFDDAPAIIYSRAFYLPNKTERGTIAQFIQEDQAEMKQHMRGAIVREIEATPTKNYKIRTFSVTLSGKAYEQVCYGIEGQYRILFCVSAKSEKDLKKALPVFREILAKYH
jgi:hypothetical protein